MGWIALAIGLLALLCYALLDTAAREDDDAWHAENALDHCAYLLVSASLAFSEVDLDVGGQWETLECANVPRR